MRQPQYKTTTGAAEKRGQRGPQLSGFGAFGITVAPIRLAHHLFLLILFVGLADAAHFQNLAQLFRDFGDVFQVAILERISKTFAQAESQHAPNLGELRWRRKATIAGTLFVCQCQIAIGLRAADA